MLLTLAASCLRPLLKPQRANGQHSLTLADLPRFARDEFGLHGLVISTDLLAGASRQAIVALREKADKAGCPCLVLFEPEPQLFTSPEESVGAAAVDRLSRVVQAAQLLGCSAVGVAVAGPDDDASIARAAERIRGVSKRAEKLELNLLVAPHESFTLAPDRVADLLKKIGGFRVGTLPDLLTATKAADPVQYLRRLTPYSSAVIAPTVRFSRKDPAAEGLRHETYDLPGLVQAVASVGYEGPLAIEYRGDGDPVNGVLLSKTILETVITQEAHEE